MENKVILREKYFDKRRNFTIEKVRLVSEKIQERFFSLDIVNKSDNFLLYHSIRNEIITHEIIDFLLEKGKNVYLPYISDDKSKLEIGCISKHEELAAGVFGIKEPNDRKNIPVQLMDIVVVPGLLFDRNGYRIGYGGGYYDKLLAEITDNTISIGLAYNCFLKDSLPVDSFDIPVDIIVTEEQTLYMGGGSN
ncbi:MAG: 5-formyltetrahydrofolate cyclo-ligase [Halanaerobiales bacterium]